MEILQMQKDMNALRRENAALQDAVKRERGACVNAMREAKRENAELRAVILCMLNRARADYAVIPDEPFRRLADMVEAGEVDFAVYDNMDGDHVVRVPVTAAVVGGMAGVMHK